MTGVVEARGITYLHPSGRGVRGASFTAEPGEILSLTGRNGSGKSTLLRVLSTLARPQAGTLLIGGVDAIREKDRARRTFFPVFDGNGHLAFATGRENLAFILGLYGGSDGGLAEDYASHFRLDLDIPVGEYSLGMKRKLLLLEALLSGRNILFLDEPTLGLDSETRSAFFRLLDEKAGKGATVVLGTNRAGEAAKGNRVLHLHDGILSDAPGGEEEDGAGLIEVRLLFESDETTEYVGEATEIPGVIARALAAGIPRRIEIRLPESGNGPVWTGEALEKIGRAPGFIRKMVTGLAEREAGERGIRVITPELVDEVKGRFGHR